MGSHILKVRTRPCRPVISGCVATKREGWRRSSRRVGDLSTARGKPHGRSSSGSWRCATSGPIGERVSYRCCCNKQESICRSSPCIAFRFKSKNVFRHNVPQENQKQKTGWRRRLDSNSWLRFAGRSRFIGRQSAYFACLRQTESAKPENRADCTVQDRQCETKG